MSENKPKISLNLDTNFLKLVAIISMTIDHVSKVFFPESVWMAILGRIAFPIFAYCIVVGCLYTHDMGRYMKRLLIFGVISQPFYIMKSSPTWSVFMENILSLNIMFTLLAGVLLINALMDIKKKWWMLVIALAMEFFIGLDYGLYGLGIMMLFYLLCNKGMYALAAVAAWILFMNGGNPINVLGLHIPLQYFALLSLPFIGIHTNIRPAIHKYFFYVFYPLHCIVIFLIRILCNV